MHHQRREAVPHPIDVGGFVIGEQEFVVPQDHQAGGIPIDGRGIVGHRDEAMAECQRSRTDFSGFEVGVRRQGHERREDRDTERSHQRTTVTVR
jgi:hypothetical protein